MPDSKQCRSYCLRELVCRDGFPQKPFCRTGEGRQPHCLNDDFAPPHLIDERGLPRLALYRLPEPPHNSVEDRNG